MPSPRQGEEKQDFIARCMGDEEANKTFPDEKQRAAFCFRQWADKDKERSTMDAEYHGQLTNFEIREDGDKPQITGYASVFNSRSEPIDGRFREVILPGAFSDVLTSEADMVALVEHDPGKLLARRSSGTLSVGEDGHGLHVTIDVPDTAVGRDTLTLVRRGDYKGMSFRFLPAKGGQRWYKEGSESIREISRFSAVPEVSLVAFPAFRATTATARSLDEFEQSLRAHEVEAWAEHQRRKLDLEAEIA